MGFYPPMKVLLEAVFKRLQAEVSGTGERAVEDKWLLRMLEQGEYWAFSWRAKDLCPKLDAEYGEPDYYFNICVFLPDVQHGEWATPPCPNGCSADSCGANGFRDNHYARYVVSLEGHYCIMSTGYICHICEEIARQINCRRLSKENAGHFRKEVKKRDGADTPVIDAPCKNQKFVSRWKGEGAFGGLGAVVSKFGEGRSSFNVFSDPHGQMEKSIIAIDEAAKAYGQRRPEIAQVDSPSGDEMFYRGALEMVEAPSSPTR